VHLELIYGRWLGVWHSNLSIGQCTIGAVVVIAFMVLLSAARTHYPQWTRFFSSARTQAEPARVSGD
jgi:hypothetical protein